MGCIMIFKCSFYFCPEIYRVSLYFKISFDKWGIYGIRLKVGHYAEDNLIEYLKVNWQNVKSGNNTSA